MLNVENTTLESFTFGNKPEDTYYLLIDLVRNEDGINLHKLTNADPRMFDQVLSDMGCILMLSGEEVQELIRRGDVDESNKHASLFKLARAEGLI